MSRVVLVTGVSRDLGARFARALAASGDREVIGLDATAPTHELGRARYVRADLRSPVLARVVLDRQVDTVVHLGLADSARSRAAAKEANVIGTMQLLAGCQKAPSFKKFVLLSSGGVYGAGPIDPARFTEEMAGRHPARSGLPRDALEVESYLGGLGVRRPDVVRTVLRPAALMGGGVRTQLTNWLSLPVVPRPLGYDARLQFLHPADAVAALEAVTLHDVPGTYNVAAPDVLTLSQILGILGRPGIGVPVEASELVSGLGRRTRLVSFSSADVRTLTWGRALDTTAFVEATGVRPHYTSRRAVEEFAALATPGALAEGPVDRVLDIAAGLLTRGRIGGAG
ncbi:NAD-dependent epimerase/dehydratase family protein [Enemella evansiae]|uniref:Epimerase n=1 Tax=Enemella evansiae TaxID=2016499 RepID=A0A255GJN7_9ACTN|nr:NAD-dependent epimerase/dehydratase family protein [Enemella evansiae]OYN97631.1 epimerase [Enemella evansiae]OYO09181.1 epimerase [Enemella evansiae]OYO16050.1 epimerase [Enemella evansiae]TDO85400.1 UDP-glucose 4-epimerase [Enemella evansiae]